MKFALTNVIFWTFINVSASFLLPNIADNAVDNAKTLTSTAFNAGCRIFADIVTQNPINKPTIENVYFQLRTPCGRKELPINETGKFRDAPEFDVNKKTVVFVTGWFVGPEKYYVDLMAKAYHCRGGYNFVVVNTGTFLSTLYVNAAYHTAVLGEFIAVGLQNLGVPVDKLHLVGHSMGAHIIGSTGRHFHKLTGQRLVRLTGLDPARNCFIEPVVFPRIGRGDADFVDNIHTNPYGVGTEEPIGDADFYPGGLELTKPGCSSSLTGRCSHERSIQYFAESVHPGQEYNFMGALCSNFTQLKSKSCSGPTSPMGYATDAKTKGIYYLSVRDTSPFGMNTMTAASTGSKECERCRQKR